MNETSHTMCESSFEALLLPTLHLKDVSTCLLVEHSFEIDVCAVAQFFLLFKGYNNMHCAIAPLGSAGFGKYWEEIYPYVSSLDRSSCGGCGLSSSACSWRASRWVHRCPPAPSLHSQLWFLMLSAHFQCLDPWACKIYHVTIKLQCYLPTSLWLSWTEMISLAYSVSIKDNDWYYSFAETTEIL